ncbi:hypothetical protein VR7878_01164 [Vibrio ruber DSM 16370]|uniref:Toxin VasX N-terminal region domain-containing protein n=1 Tax=Vibrio ruber (strain DSM 16370 / JCM 11486 / BCRC 17186 / CECT 7878 / LMG 23124 / VR1) TaxID=1123498 RepID=A0A1R4LFX3_VIBR1|nr:toxin VasX [Vibrio ruber]SJN55277.1 hypothetical protein VR7878_01164 [Vibrio ruber DSM 16370]
MTEHILLANNAAASQSTEDTGSLTGACPYMNPMIQLVPMRYAMSEEGESVPENLNDSLYRDDGVPQGFRPLNPGFLYIIHSEDKETLYEFEVKDDQSLIGRYFEKGTDAFQDSGQKTIVVPRRGVLHALFMPVAMTPERAEILLGASGDQSSLMNRVLLGDVDPINGTKGLMPTEKIPGCIDFSAQRTESGGQYDSGQYWWLSNLIFQPEAQSPVQSSVLPEYEKDSAVLLINDICADLVEAAERQNDLKTQYKTWYEKEVDGHRNCDRYEVAQLLNNLMQVDQFLAGRFDSLLDSLGIHVSDDEERKALSARLKNHIEVLNDQNEYHWEAASSVPGIFGKDGYQSSYPANMGRSVNNKANAMAKKLAEDYSISYYTAKSTLEKCAAEYKQLIEGGAFGKDGIKTVIHYDEMTDFVTKWDDYKVTVSENLERLNPYVKGIAPKWSLLAAYISPKNKEHFKIKLDYEDILTAFFKNNDDQWLLEYYAGEDDFPLSVYDDIASDTTFVSVKDVLNIRKKFVSIGDALKGVESFNKKVETANNLNHLNPILDDDLKARVVQSLSLKNEAFVVSMTAALQAPGGEMNFTQRLSNNLDKLSQGTKQLLNLNFKANGIQWHIPDQQAASKLQSLHQELDQINKNLKQTEQTIKAIKGRNNSILQMSKSARHTARANYVRELRAAKRSKNQLLGQFRSKYNEILSHSGPEVSLGIKKSGSYPMSQVMDEAKQMVRSINARGTVREMLTAEGKPDAGKIVKTSISFLLTYMYVWSAWHAWEALTDDDPQEGELLTFAEAGITATASVISSAGTIYTAWLNASLKVGDEALHEATLARLATWTVYSTPIVTAMGAIGMGIRTWNAGMDAYKSLSNDLSLFILSSFRFAASAAGLGVGIYESYRYMSISSKFFTGGIVGAEAAMTSTLRVAAKWIRLNVYLWVAFFVLDKLWQYYKWPPLVDWADDTAWGKDDQGWSLTNHYEVLAPQSFKPGARYEVLNNTYTEDQSAETEVQLKIFLPQVSRPTAENCKLELKAFCRDPRRRFRGEWVDVLESLKVDATLLPMNGGCELTFFVRSDWLNERYINQIRCCVSLRSGENKWYRNNWDFRMNKAMHIPFTDHNVLSLSQEEIDAPSGSHLVAWS